MSKSKNFKGFSDRFKEKLSLTQTQVSLIDEAEYNFLKDYHWNRLPKHKESKNAYLDEILKHLNNDQLEVYNSYVDAQNAKKEKREKEKFNKTLEVQSVRLNGLNLTSDQLEAYVKKKINFTELRLQKMKQAKTKEEMELDILKRKVYEEEIFPIFDAKQLAQYKELKKSEEIKRAEEDKKWRTKHEKEWFEHRYNIDLNEEQVKALFSKDFNHPHKDFEGEYFSDFEMMEKERNWFAKHLTKEQFKVYEPFYEERIKNLIESIKKRNIEHDKVQLQRTKSYLEYYLENVLPHATEARKRIEAKLTVEQKKRIEEIRHYYFTQQDVYKDKFIKQHKRHYKDLKPNALREFQLRYKIEKINFNLCYLYGNEQSKKLMTSNLQAIVNEENEKLKNVYSKLKEFQIQNYESTGGNYGASRVISIPIKKGEEHLEKIGLLLLEPDLNKNLEKIR